ncbi:MAG TPA: hypothetical protein VK277_05420 [Acidimicrobiales bacterium]|nr:hypothetical protein [Acidimicrobiales bacterium]
MRRRGSAGLAVTAAAVAVAAGCLADGLLQPAAASPASATPSALVTKALAAAGTRSFHYVATTTVGSEAVTIVGDASSRWDDQTATIRQGKGVGILTTRVAPGGLYYRGNNLGLIEYLRLNSAYTRPFDGKWIYVPTTQQSFASLVHAVSPAAVLAELSLRGTLSLSNQQLGGTNVVAVRGRGTLLALEGQTGPATLYLSTGRPSLPVLFVERGTGVTKRDRLSISFSRWGERVRVAAPKDTVPASALNPEG